VAIRTFGSHAPSLGERVFVDRSAVVIGDVALGTDSSVWPLTVIRADMHQIRIGARTSVQDASVLHITHAGPFNPDGYPLLIGDDVTIGHKVMLHGCTLGSRILVGMGSTVMDGAVVEDDVIIGASRQAAGERVPVRWQPGQASARADRQGTRVLYVHRRQLREAQGPALARGV
jgi:carbonic anhydrase/acetyltransferase-like protein (isoleucine patch superfamily)